MLHAGAIDNTAQKKVLLIKSFKKFKVGDGKKKRKITQKYKQSNESAVKSHSKKMNQWFSIKKCHRMNNDLARKSNWKENN
ncbi:hypothetical protein T4A_9118 [Trichinella pseudospiralis]|uniref:Uncharacterized protein n=1 Tax=Trichinella pseudospiralis TaxID=6337 RepID=A0A0V1J3F8_TRIPS|nr:hypothetical protein T4A_9118 [Trichinella pseudospiralis]KRY81393.1 hypothetical protein T4D_5174 [Trichinella pseudospiralis]KRZ29513.1 hypothetical protein T4C_1807 [Trichinella pseudospiralis]